MDPSPITRIEQALMALVRRAVDPRGNQRINTLAGVDIERAGATMLGRIASLEPARLSTLADAAGVEMSTASRQVARLVEQGYVVRASDPADGRAAVHRLSPAGRDVVDRLIAARHQWFEELLADFDDDEREGLAGLLERFVHGVEEHDQEQHQ